VDDVRETVETLVRLNREFREAPTEERLNALMAIIDRLALLLDAGAGRDQGGLLEPLPRGAYGFPRPLRDP
jgi:hypothetical protein